VPALLSRLGKKSVGWKAWDMDFWEAATGRLPAREIENLVVHQSGLDLD